MKILLTGVNGQLGWALKPKLSLLGQLIEADRNLLDLSQPYQIGSTLDQIKPNFIVNAAAYTAVDKAQSQTDLCFLVNTQAPIEMAKWSKVNGVPLIHFSTDYVFNGNNLSPQTELLPTDPQNIYGQSKALGEKGVFQEASDLAFIFRTTWVYGLHGNNFMKTMLRLFKEKPELKIINDQLGAPTGVGLISDVMSYIVGYLKNNSDRVSKLSGLYHLSAKGQTSWFDYARLIYKIAHQNGIQMTCPEDRIWPISTADYPTPAKRPLYSVLDSAKIEKAFDLRLPHWDQEVVQTLNVLTSAMPPVFK